MEDPAIAQLREGCRWLTTFEAAAYLNLSRQSILRIIHDGQLKVAKIGPHYRIDREDLDLWLCRRKKIAPPYRRGTRPLATRRTK